MLSELEMRGCEVRWQERMDRYMAMSCCWSGGMKLEEALDLCYHGNG